MMEINERLQLARVMVARLQEELESWERDIAALEEMQDEQGRVDAEVERTFAASGMQDGPLFLKDMLNKDGE